MVGYRLSRTGVAKQPFYIESIARNLWTAEELCWLLVEHPALIDETILDLRLTRWLTQEFGLLDTVLEMERSLKEGRGAAAFLTPLLTDTDYLTPQELRGFCMKLERLARIPQAVRLRLKGDALMEYSRFGQALAVYREAEEVAEGQGVRFAAELYHNSGTASMQLLEYEEACASFARAYRLSGSTEDLETYLLALRLAKPYDRFREDALALHAEESLLRGIEDRIRQTGVEEAEGLADAETLSAEVDRLCAAYRTEAGD